MTWETQCSVLAQVDRTTVWEWHSNVDNWARFEGDAVDSITIDGPFQSGATGITKMAGQEAAHWRLTEVDPPRRTTIEMELPDAVLRFVWTFEEVSNRRTRLTQRILLEGPGAAGFAPMMEESFGANLGEGMKRIAAEIEKSAGGTRT